MTEKGLAGMTVLVTRPQDQAGDLVEAIESRGGNVILFPVLEIGACDPATDTTPHSDPTEADITIFVSANAVRHGHRFAAGRIAAVGPATAAALADAGKTVDIVPTSGYDSESLLEEQALNDVAGKTVQIVRGGDGRELLGRSLRERGAGVRYRQVYERRLPAFDETKYAKVRSALQNDGIDAVTVMSIASLGNLRELVPDSDWPRLLKVPLVTPASRVIKEALHRYPEFRTVLARGISPVDLVDAICACKESTPDRPHD